MELNVRLLKQIIADICYFIASCNMLLTIIICCNTITNDCYCYIDRSYSLISVSYIENNFSKVCVIVLKLLCLKSHICLAGIFSCCTSCSTECEVRLFVKLVANLNIIACYSMVFSIIVSCVVMTCDRYNYFINSCDFLITVCYIKGYLVKVSILVSKL